MREFEPYLPAPIDPRQRGGQNRHTWTVEDLDEIWRLARAHTPCQAIADSMGVGIDTFMKYHGGLVRQARGDGKGFVMTAIFELAEGHTPEAARARIFLAKALCGLREGSARDEDDRSAPALDASAPLGDMAAAFRDKLREATG